MERAELARVLGARVSAHGSRRVLISEADPRRFMAAFAQAAAGEADVFLCDPKWAAAERAQVDELLKSPVPAAEPATPGAGWLMIPTGGTSGRIRFARHDAATLAAAVRGFTRHFGTPQVNVLGVLPLHHVSGLMGWLRCALTGGEHRSADWKALEAGAFPAMPAKLHGWAISLVPTQLERLLRHEAAGAWLGRFRTVLLGGGPAWPELLERAAALRLPLAPSYGLTESAAMLAALRPADFIAGARSCGPVLPHVRIGFDEEGGIMIGGGSVFRGYYPHWRGPGPFSTEDGGYLDERGHLHVTGRRDTVIITGGEKVHPGEVEAVLRGCGELPDVVVLGLPDTEWGQQVIAAYPESAQPRMKRVADAMSRLLSPAKRPKLFVPLQAWPANPQGKVNRAEVARLAGLAIRSGLGRCT